MQNTAGSGPSPVSDARRDRMHGGTSPGAPKGNRNAWKHGRRSAVALEERRRFRDLLRALKEGLGEIELK